MNLRRVLMLSACCVVFASSCRLLPDNRPMVTLPVSAVNTLTTSGVPVAIVDSQVLSTVFDSSTGAGRVVFQHEWRDAPSMTMVSIGNGTAATADVLLRTMAGLQSPLESDLAICDSRVVGGVQQQLPPNADGKWSSVEIPMGDRPLLVNRIKGELTGISIVPTNGDGSTLGTTFQLDVSLMALSVGLGIQNRPGWNAPDGYHLDIASVGLSCTAAIRPHVTSPPSACGEHSIGCLPGTVVLNIAQPTSNLPAEMDDVIGFAWDLVGEQAITELLENGVVLHFENFAATGLGFDTTGTLLLTGASSVLPDGTSFCSPNALVPPTVPPTRGLVQTHAYDGYGEVRSVDGFVKGFTLRPFMTADFVDEQHGVTRSIRRDQRLYPSDDVTTKYAAEFPRIDQFNVSRLNTRLRADRYNSSCWTRDTTVNDFGRGFPPIALVLFEGKFRRPAEISKFLTRKFRYTSVAPVPPDEVREAMAMLGQTCPGECTGYWRVEGVMGSANYPAPWPPLNDDLPFGFDVPPYLGQFWFGDDPTRRLNEVSGCDMSIHIPNNEVVIARPEVRLFDSLFDSARVNSMAYAPKGNTRFATEGTFTYQNKTHRRITMESDCWTVGPTACWESQMPAPDRFTVGAYDGSSGTTMPRERVRDAVRGPSVYSYGIGTAAPWGFFDRSQIDLYSSVPVEYSQAGLTTAAWDWRGSVKVDWAHVGPFPAPNGSSEHAAAGTASWWGVDNYAFPDLIAYRADFSRDQLMVRRRNGTDRSFCVSEDNLTATMERVWFKNWDHSHEAHVPATEIFAPNGTGRVQVIGSGYSTGPANAYFNHP